MDSDTDVCQTEQPQISYSVDFTAEQSSAMCHGITYMYPIGSGGYRIHVRVYLYGFVVARCRYMLSTSLFS